MSTKLNLRSLTKTQLANHLKNLKMSRKNKPLSDRGGRPKPSYLNIKGSRDQKKPASSVVKNNSKMNTNRQLYRNYIQRMVNTGFLDPKEPTFRNDVVENMKTLRSEKPTLTRMNNSEWFVNNMVSKARKPSGATRSANNGVVVRNSRATPIQITTAPPLSKTRQLLLQRRKTLTKKKGGRSRTLAPKPRRITPKVTANSSNSNAVKKSNNGSNRGFNMNKSNKSESNSNSNGHKKSSANNKSNANGNKNTRAPSTQPIMMKPKKKAAPRFRLPAFNMSASNNNNHKSTATKQKKKASATKQKKNNNSNTSGSYQVTTNAYSSFSNTNNNMIKRNKSILKR